MSRQNSGIFTISSGAARDTSAGMANAAFDGSTVELNVAVLRDINNSNNLGLDLSDLEDEVETEEGNFAVNCTEHARIAGWFCVDCSVFICAKCQKVHHCTHETVSTATINSNTAVVTDMFTKYSTHAETYQRSLLKERDSLDNTLTHALSNVDQAYELILSRVAEKRSETVNKVKAAISSQRQIISGMLNSNQEVIDGYHGVLNADQSSPGIGDKRLKQLPNSLVVPKTSITTDVPIDELIIPDVKIELNSSTDRLEMVSCSNIMSLQVDHINTVGAKGHRNMQFKNPGGLCLDRANNVYVADEGNNRIQKISKDGNWISTFTWADGKNFISGVAYDPLNDSLIVPRAYNDRGLLMCSEFSRVTLDGEEVSRFAVQGMQGGLFVHCGDDGTLLISDLVKKSLYVIKDGHVQLEINNKKQLQQPAFCAFGKDGEILVVDSGRKAVAVFDSNGLHIRDIGTDDDAKALKKPRGIAIDRSCGIIAVTDWRSDEVVLYSYQGKALASVGGFKCPHSVAINDSHRLLVTDCWNNQLKVFSYSSNAEVDESTAL